MKLVALDSAFECRVITASSVLFRSLVRVLYIVLVKVMIV